VFKGRSLSLSHPTAATEADKLSGKYEQTNSFEILKNKT
jgi:hypothetical protein